jgi:hypothetical protein
MEEIHETEVVVDVRDGLVDDPDAARGDVSVAVEN